MVRMQKLLVAIFVLVIWAGLPFFSLKTAVAADLSIANIFIERTDNESLETIGGNIEIIGSGLKDASVIVRTDSGSQILGKDLGAQIYNDDDMLKFSLTGTQFNSILFADKLRIGGKTVSIDITDMPGITSVTPKIVFAGETAPEGTVTVMGSNMKNLNQDSNPKKKDNISFGIGLLQANITCTDQQLTINNLTGDKGYHDIIFTRSLTEVENVSETVTIRKIYKSQFRVIERFIVDALEMFPNTGVAGQTTVYFQAPNLPKSSVFFLLNTSDAYLESNLGRNPGNYSSYEPEYISNPTGDDILKVTVPQLTSGTYQVILTNYLTAPKGQDLRSSITKELLVGEFLIVTAGDSAEIKNITPTEGTNENQNPVTIQGRNFDELRITGLTMDSQQRNLSLNSTEEISIDYGPGQYLTSHSSAKKVLVSRTIKVIIGPPAQFTSVNEQAFSGNYDTLRVKTGTISSSEIEADPSRDVVVDLTTLLTVVDENGTPTGETYKFRELATVKDGFTFLNSYIEPTINAVSPDKIQVDSLTHTTKEDMVICISGESFVISKSVDSDTGNETILFPKLNLGGILTLWREGKSSSDVYYNGGNILPGASLEVMDGLNIMDGSSGKNIGNKIILRIPAGISVPSSLVNTYTYIEVTNPKNDSSEYGYAVKKDDILQFITAAQNHTPIITNVDPRVFSVEGQTGVQIEGINFNEGVQVFIDGQLVKSTRSSGRLIRFDAPVRHEGICNLVVMNPEGGADTFDLSYVKTQTNPNIKSVTPPAGTINSLVVIDGEDFVTPDPTASAEGQGIYRLVGTRILFDDIDINEYYYSSGNTIGLQNYTSPSDNLIIQIKDNQPVLADYHNSILFKDAANNQFYKIYPNAKNEIILTNGYASFKIKVENGQLKVVDQNNIPYPLTVEKDHVLMSGQQLTMCTPYRIDNGIITGHRVRVSADGTRIIAVIPDLGVQGSYDVSVVNPDTKKDTLSDGFFFFRKPQKKPAITSIEPDEGSTAGGYNITINGSNYEDNGSVKTRVFINGIEINPRDVQVGIDDKCLSVKVPPYTGDLKSMGLSKIAVPVILLNPTDGGSVGIENGFTYVAPNSNPVIDKLSKTTGNAAGGDYVLITGRDFRYYEPFEDNLKVDFQYNEGEIFTDINGDGIFTDLSAQQTTEELSTGDLAVLPKVYFGIQPAEIQDFGPGYIGVITPPGQGEINVYIVNNDFGISNSIGFTYITSKPAISDVTPDTGKKQGHENIEITGSGFVTGEISILQPDGTVTAENTVLVRFGDLTNSGHESGLIVGGVVSNLEIEGGLTLDYSAESQRLEISLAASEGQEFNRTFSGFRGDTVYIDLQNLQDSEGLAYSGWEWIKVWIDSRQLLVERGYSPQVKYINSNQLSAISPTYYKVGKVSVTVINPDGMTAQASFTYKNPDSVPKITDITRDSIPPVDMTINGEELRILRINFQGKSVINIFGEDFRENAVIKIGDVISIAPADINYTLPSKLTFTMPLIDESLVGKLYRVVIINEDGGVASSDIMPSGQNSIYIQFTKGDTTPAVTGITPHKGPASGGTQVLISGSDFRNTVTGYSGALKVYLGGELIAPDDVKVIDYKTISIITPPNTAGFKEVRVENPDGETGIGSDGFLYISSPVISSVLDPVSGEKIKAISINGGETIKIIGSGFLPGAEVYFAPIISKASDESPENEIIYREASRKGELDTFILEEGYKSTEVTFVDSETLIVVTPAGKLSTGGVIVINPDNGASEIYAQPNYDLEQLTAPTNVTAEIIHDDREDTDRYIKIHWLAVTGAVNYEIYVSEDNNKEFIGTTELTTYIYREIKPNTRYRFVVRAIGPEGISTYSETSNTVKTDDEVGNVDSDGDLNEKTRVRKSGTSVTLQIGSADFDDKPMYFDLTKGDLAGAREVVVIIPARVVTSTKAQDIEIIGTDFNLRFNPDVFLTETMVRKSKSSDVGVRFTFRRMLNNSVQTGNTVSPIYELSAIVYNGAEQKQMDFLTGFMYLAIDRDMQKIQMRRLTHVYLYRYDDFMQKWESKYSWENNAFSENTINRMGIYALIAARR